MSQTFAIIKTNHLTELGSHKPSGCAVLIYTALLSFSRNKTSCFPSIATISKTIGGAFSVRSIQRGLLFLESIGFIKRNEKRSKQRFVMLKQIGQMCRKALSGQKWRKNKTNEKYSFYKKHKNKKSSSSAVNGDGSNLCETYTPCDAERIFGDWVVRDSTLGDKKDLSLFSAEDLKTIGAALRSFSPDEVEWRELMWDSWGETFLKIKKLTPNKGVK